MTQSSEPSISVVVPCHNVAQHGGAAIRACIDSLLAQDHAPSEIIAVDDGSSDRTSEVLAALAVTVVRRHENGGAGAARVTGAARAAGQIVAFLDADCTAPGDWLAKIARSFERDPELGGVGGRYDHLPRRTWQGQLGALEEEFAHAVFAHHSEEAIPPGGNCAFRKEVWLGGRTWRELSHFRGMGSGEDSVVGHEIRRRARLEFRSDLVVLHGAREEGGLFRRHFHRGLSRSTILTKGLTDRTESRLAFAAYGGPALTLGSLLFGVGLFSLLLTWLWPGPALGVALLSLAASALLSSRFLRFLEQHRWRLGVLRRQGFRVMLLLRTLCWAAGAGLGLARHMRFAVERRWNISCSILHFWRPGRISKLFYFVTSRCNARCAFCFNLENVVNWKQRRPDELTLDEVVQIARRLGRLPYLTLSGGEPFVRADLPEVIQAFYEHSRTQWVTIPTNAALTERTVSATLRILNRCPGLFLTIQVSIDSLFEEHDRSRLITDGFRKLTETLRLLGEMRASYRNLRLQIATCYADFNRDRIEEIVEYCRREFDFDQQMFYLIRDPQALITKDDDHVCQSYFRMLARHEAGEWRSQRRSLWGRAVRALQGLVYRDLAEIKARKTFLRPCVATQKFVTLWDDGQVTPCEILEGVKLGNIREFDYDFYSLKRAQRVNDLHRREIVDKKCNCDWMCAIPINMLYDRRAYGAIARALLDPPEPVQRTSYGHGPPAGTMLSLPVVSATETAVSQQPHEHECEKELYS